MPAAAVIPAPIAYVNVAAVKKLVVESVRAGGGAASGRCHCRFFCFARVYLSGFAVSCS